MTLLLSRVITGNRSICRPKTIAPVYQTDSSLSIASFYRIVLYLGSSKFCKVFHSLEVRPVITEGVIGGRFEHLYPSAARILKSVLRMFAGVSSTKGLFRRPTPAAAHSPPRPIQAPVIAPGTTIGV